MIYEIGHGLTKGIALPKILRIIYCMNVIDGTYSEIFLFKKSSLLFYVHTLNYSIDFVLRNNN